MVRALTSSLLILVALITTSWGAITESEKNSLRVQIFLENNNFMPGYLDGRSGQFTALAIQNYNRKHGKDDTDISYVKLAQSEVPNPLAIAVVPSFAKKFIDPKLSTNRNLQAKRKDMPYRSYAEFMAERYHTSVGFLKKINNVKAINNLAPRKSILVPNVDPFLIENLATGRMHKTEERFKDRYVIIDTSINQLKIYEKKFAAPLPVLDQQSPQFVESLEDMVIAAEAQIKLKKTIQAHLKANHKLPELPETDEALFKSLQETDLIATFPITPGKPQFIRRGFWKVKISIELPIWRYDKTLLETGVRGKNALIIPGGPNNPVGVVWNGLTRKGIGIHGTSSPETIGRSQSAGCIRLANWDVVKFPTFVRPGAKVWLK